MVVIVVVFKSVLIIDAHQCTGKGGYLSECDKQGLVDLSLRVDIDSAEEKYETTDGEDGGGDELYVQILFHRLFFGAPKELCSNGESVEQGGVL